MVNIGFGNIEHIDTILYFEQQYFNNEAYSRDTLIDILKDNYLLKNNINLFVLTNELELIGYIIFSIYDDFTDILKIFVREKDRKNGFATMMLKKVYSLAKRYSSKKIMIEVRSKNESGINLYIKNGFTNISTRKDYYKNPDDDALIFEKEVL